MKRRRIQDNSPRFDRNKSYAIGVLQANAGPNDVPERFATSPIKPLYLSGTDLIGNGMRSCRDFLVSKNCHFKVGSAVHFYEVEYSDNNEPSYKNIFIGSPLPQAVEQGLNDKTEQPVINNIIPSYHTSESEKMLFRTQSEAIAYYQKCLQDERKQFAAERNLYVIKQQEQRDKRLELNLLINRLQSQNEALQIKYEEANKYAERLTSISNTVEQTEGLADKGIAVLDNMLGEGTSQQIVTGFETGVGNGIGKLIDFGIDLVKEKGVFKSFQQQEEKQEQQQQYQVIEPTINTEKYDRELKW
jgi:hypothetical protein